MASEIRVDKITSLSGVGTITPSSSGIDITGITTVATLKATTGIVTTLTATTGIVTTLTTNTLTANSTTKVGSGVTLSPDGDIFTTGVTTSTTFVGAVTGNVTGNVSGNVTGNVTGNQSGGTVSATSAAVADLTSGRVVLAGTSGELQDDSNLSFGSNQLTVHEAKLKGNQLLFSTSGTVYIDHSTTGQDIQFRTSVSSSQDTTGPTIKSTGNIAFASGKGIDFSATSGSGTSELFDDYEEGTFTPGLAFGATDTGMSYGSRSGSYVKIGRFVYCQGQLDLTSKGSSTGDATFTGLPFTVGDYLSGTSQEGSGFITWWANMGSGSIPTTFWISQGGTSATIYRALEGSHGAIQTQTNSHWNNNSQVRFLLQYMAA